MRNVCDLVILTTILLIPLCSGVLNAVSDIRTRSRKDSIHMNSLSTQGKYINVCYTTPKLMFTCN